MPDSAYCVTCPRCETTYPGTWDECKAWYLEHPCEPPC